MFVGWFKIEGHSNPKSRKGFSKRNKSLKDQKRLGDGILSMKASESFVRIKKEYRPYRKLVSIISAVVVVCSVLFFTISSMNTESRVHTEMEKEQIIHTGSSEFISPENLRIRNAKQRFQAGNYEQAYSWYKEAYEFGTLKREVYAGLSSLSEKLCASDPKYCNDAQEWKAVLKRIDKSKALN